jgi:hypothetical protein
MNRQRHDRKSAYGADPVEPVDQAADNEPGKCAAYGCFLPGDAADTTQADNSTKWYCPYHDGQKTADFDAISQHLRRRAGWFNVVTLAHNLLPHEFDELVKRGVAFNVPKALQPAPGMNKYQWRQMVRTKVRDRLMQEIAALVDQRAEERGVDENRTRPDRLSWAAKIILGKTAHQDLDAA